MCVVSTAKQIPLTRPRRARPLRGFTLVELLVVIAIIAVLLAILMPALAGMKATARRLQCSSRLAGMGKAFDMYISNYDGAMPTIEWHQNAPYNYTYPGVESYYILAKIRSNPYWCHHGCFFGAGFIDSGLIYYCPATEGWLDDYMSNRKGGREWGDPAGWVTDQALKSKKGYVYWPMGKDPVTQDVWDYWGQRRIDIRTNYKIGLPQTPQKLVDTLMNRALMADYSFHMIKGSGWNLNVLFPDGHVVLQPQPKDEDNLGMWHNESNPFPSGTRDRSVSPRPVTVAEFMYQLQP